ncbi:hypothetical protein DFJ73DRAFT_814172 [Zopfochytrium polystomum]|nr:hypothetical protein DFJ73DRAFT_814172 [Zopfochytrium polystomum]
MGFGRGGGRGRGRGGGGSSGGRSRGASRGASKGGSRGGGGGASSRSGSRGGAVAKASSRGRPSGNNRGRQPSADRFRASRGGSVMAKRKDGNGGAGREMKRGERDASPAKGKGASAARGRGGRGRGGRRGGSRGGKKRGPDADGSDDGLSEEEGFEEVPAEPEPADDGTSGWESDASEVSEGEESGDESGAGGDDENDDDEGGKEEALEKGGATSDDADVGAQSEDGDESEDGDSDGERISKSVKAANRKHKKTGGFQSMGLSYPIYSGILHKGYKVPTPIQRKAIPVIMDNRDIVAMARTGSGKTAAFIIPLLEKLKSHSARVGARGLILTPARELALQTLKFVKELGKHTDLRACMLVGGDSLDEQFAAVASNPDIIIATPGRLMHLIIEMNIDLKTVEYVVFDEADRLFEMGFAEQLHEILFKLPEARQTLLVSATLPKMLVDFAKAGLSDPALIRLDVDTKIGPDLQMLFFNVKSEEKDAALLYMLSTVIPADQQTIVFVATKHLVEYVHELLTKAGISNTYIFGSLDQVARNIHIAKFRNGDRKVLVVTDVAARGIDIPLLDNVINYDFPASSKLMVHRVGRVGRAGRKGIAFSLVCNDELPFLVDFQLFTARPLIYSSVFTDESAHAREPNYVSDIILGHLPQSALDVDRERIQEWLKQDVTLQTLQQGVKNGYRMYYKTRGTAARESYIRAKEISEAQLGVHPYIGTLVGVAEVKRVSILDEIARFRPPETVFEVGKRGMNSPEAVLMQLRRRQLSSAIEKKKSLLSGIHSESRAKQITALTTSKHETGEVDLTVHIIMSEGFSNILKESFTTIPSKKRKRGDGEKKSDDSRDSDFYMSHFPKDSATERGYAVNASSTSGSSVAQSFAERASDVVMDVAGDDADGLRTSKRQKGALVWDKKKHRFIRETTGGDNRKRIKTESGASVPASFKSDRFEKWQKRTRLVLPRNGEEELPAASIPTTRGTAFGVKTYRHNNVTPANPNSKNYARKMAAAERNMRLEAKGKGTGKKIKIPVAGPPVSRPSRAAKGGSELKTAAQIANERRAKEKRLQRTGRHKKGGKKRR